MNIPGKKLSAIFAAAAFAVSVAAPADAASPQAQPQAPSGGGDALGPVQAATAQLAAVTEWQRTQTVADCICQ